MQIPSDVLEAFASDPIGGDHLLYELSRSASPLAERLRTYIQGFSNVDLDFVRSDSTFKGLYGDSKNVEELARFWLAEKRITNEICHRRLIALVGSGQERPSPYGLAPVRDIELDSEDLVPLSKFEFDGARLIRNKHAFTIVSTTASPNSTYWLANVLCDLDTSSLQIHVRLDPFLHGHIDSFPQMMYRMIVYGTPLNWELLSKTKKEVHGRWQPEHQDHRTSFTDYCWQPGAEELSFVCEEVPRDYRRPARYLHAIYSLPEEAIIHLDGALRIYTDEELKKRNECHVRKAGKIGRRKKVFRADGHISRNQFSLVAQAFMVWNDDLSKYFRSLA